MFPYLSLSVLRVCMWGVCVPVLLEPKHQINDGGLSMAAAGIVIGRKTPWLMHVARRQNSRIPLSYCDTNVLIL